MIALAWLASEGRESHLIPDLSHSSIISIGKLCDAVCKTIFDEQTVNITRKGNIKLKVRRDHKTGLLHIPIHNQQTGKKTSLLRLTNMNIMWTRQKTYQTKLNISTNQPSAQSNKILQQKPEKDISNHGQA